MPPKKLTKNDLCELLAYDPETGELTWRERDRSRFSCERLWRMWNTRFAGHAAFTADSGKGYRSGTINGRRALAHRIVWLMVHGVDADQIDHINGNRSDNRIQNLRSVTHQENGRNKRRQRTNVSGATGVGFSKKSKKWVAYIRVGNTQMHLGHFSSFDAAVAARKSAEVKHGFHPNHGSTL